MMASIVKANINCWHVITGYKLEITSCASFSSRWGLGMSLVVFSVGDPDGDGVSSSLADICESVSSSVLEAVASQSCQCLGESANVFVTDV